MSSEKTSTFQGMQKIIQNHWRRFIFALAFLVVIFLFISRFNEFHRLALILTNAAWQFFLLSALLQCGCIVISALIFQSIYRLFDISSSNAFHMLKIVTASNFVNIIAPSMGMSGLTVFLAEGRKNGQAAGKITSAIIVYLILEYLGLFAVLALGFVVLIRRNDLTLIEVIATIFLLLMAVVLALILFLCWKMPDIFGHFLTLFAQKINNLSKTIFRKDLIKPEHAIHFVNDLSDGFHAFYKKPFHLLLLFALEITGRILQIGTYILVFQTFKVPISIGTVIASFGISNLFLIVSPTPAGLGFVEGTLVLTLTSMFLSTEQATVISLGYRAISFWAPFLIGFVFFTRVMNERTIEKSQNGGYGIDRQ